MDRVRTKQKSKETREKRAELYRRIFLGVTAILTIVYLLWRVFFTLPLNDSIPEIIFGVFLVAAEVVTCFTTFELFYRKYKSTKFELECPEVDFALYPHIDVFIATHNEPLDILYKTANACTYMEYPDKDKVHIYFSDDGNRPEVAELAENLGIGYIGMEGNTHAKSGNLNHALLKTNSPLIATFDADMIPQRTFLMKTVPYFFLPTYVKDESGWRERSPEEIDPDYKIGLIQTPQSFYNPDLFQYNLYAENIIPNEQDFFSREINIMRNSSNAIAYTGSNTTILRSAMEEIGGFPYHTITEDFEVSIRMQKAHYITYATSEIQAAGLTTTDFRSMLKQRKRWCQGIIQSLHNTHAMFTPKLPIEGRITYLTSYLYWWSFFNRIIFTLAPIMFALFDFRVVDNTFNQLLVLWLPSYVMYTMSFKYLSNNLRSNRWSQIIDTIFAPYLIICVILETFGIKEKKFKITNKEKTEKSDLIYATPHIILIVMSILAIYKMVAGKYGWALIYSSILIFWLCHNLISLIFAVFFMSGRRTYRKWYRIKADEDLRVEYNNQVIKARTIDLSDGGILFFTENLIEFEIGDSVELTVESKHYRCVLHGAVRSVYEKEEQYRCAVTVKPIDEKNKREYFQMVYDRDHTLPMELDPWVTLPDDLKRNAIERIKRSRRLK